MGHMMQNRPMIPRPAVEELMLFQRVHALRSRKPPGAFSYKTRQTPVLPLLKVEARAALAGRDREGIRRARPWSRTPALPDEITALQSSAISGPYVARGRKPVLLLPDSAHTWTPSHWKVVTAHEQQHLRQQDLPLAWLPRLVHCFYWWHPLAHWLKPSLPCRKRSPLRPRCPGPLQT